MYKINSKKTMFLMLVTTTFLMCLPTAVSSINEIGTLEYKEDRIIAINGNVTLMFSNSSSGYNDIDLYWRIYSNTNNLTIYSLGSKTITITPGFENDTKNYDFFDPYTGFDYRIYVDYSDIDVPKAVEDLLNETILEKQQQINSLQSEIVNLTNEVNSLNNTIQGLNSQIGTLVAERDNYKSELEAERLKTDPLKMDIYNLTSMVEDYENITTMKNFEIDNKQNIIDDLEKSIKQLRDPWMLGYVYKGKSFGPHFNLTSIIVGIVIILVTGFLIVSKIKSKKAKKQIEGAPTSILDKTRITGSILGGFKNDDNKLDKAPYGKPMSFAPLSDEELTKVDDIVTTMKPENIDWKIKKDTDEYKSWSYNGGEPIKAKKHDGIWEIFVDGKKQPDTYGTIKDVMNNIEKYQKEYHHNDISEKLDEKLNKGDGNEP